MTIAATHLARDLHCMLPCSMSDPLGVAQSLSRLVRWVRGGEVDAQAEVTVLLASVFGVHEDSALDEAEAWADRMETSGLLDHAVSGESALHFA